MIRVHVTGDDIAKGARHRAELCPIACAMTRTLGTQVRVFSSGRAWIACRGEHVHTELPADVGRWADRFDKTGEGSPFVFEAPGAPAATSPSEEKTSGLHGSTVPGNAGVGAPCRED